MKSIDELANQCYVESKIEVTHTFDYPAFAKLLIEQCCDLADDAVEDNNLMMYYPSAHIRKHYGIPSYINLIPE